jgi:hypothetical protein
LSCSRVGSGYCNAVFAKRGFAGTPSSRHPRSPAAGAAAIPLLELLDGRLQNPDGDAAANTCDSTSPRTVSVPGIHAYVNRVLQKWTKISGAQDSSLTKGLTPHSFRRGAAQNANGDSTISTPWILDRGGWSLRSVSKAFYYIVSTTHEDQRVAKSLSGLATEASPRLPSLGVFDAAVGRTIQQVQKLIFAQSFGFPDICAMTS